MHIYNRKYTEKNTYLICDVINMFFRPLSLLPPLSLLDSSPQNSKRYNYLQKILPQVNQNKTLHNIHTINNKQDLGGDAIVPIFNLTRFRFGESKSISNALDCIAFEPGFVDWCRSTRA